MANPNIVVTEPMYLSDAQWQRISGLGAVTKYDTFASTPDEWMTRVADADVICVGKVGLEQKIYELKNKFISLPYVGAQWIDTKITKANGLTISNSPGCNKFAVAEWILAMCLNLARRLPDLSRNTIFTTKQALRPTMGLQGKKIAVLGAGQVGRLAGNWLSHLGANVVYFDKGGSLTQTVENATFIINCLGVNAATKGMLNATFFESLPKGCFFVSVAWQQIYDVDALLHALEKGIIAAAADDAGQANIGLVTDPLYRKLLKHPNMQVTPHIAFNTDTTATIAYDMMIDNIEAFLAGKPINQIA